MIFMKWSESLLFFVFVLILFVMVLPAFAEEATINLPSLNPSPSIEVSPTGLPQMETGEQLPLFDNPNQNIYKDPQGKFTITFPQGTTQGPRDRKSVV